MAEQLLNGAQVGAFGEQVGGEGVAEDVRMQIPIGIEEPAVFLDNAAQGAGGEPLAAVVEEDGFASLARRAPQC